MDDVGQVFSLVFVIPTLSLRKGGICFLLSRETFCVHAAGRNTLQVRNESRFLTPFGMTNVGEVRARIDDSQNSFR